MAACLATPQVIALLAVQEAEVNRPMWNCCHIRIHLPIRR